MTSSSAALRSSGPQGERVLDADLDAQCEWFVPVKFTTLADRQLSNRQRNASFTWGTRTGHRTEGGEVVIRTIRRLLAFLDPG